MAKDGAPKGKPKPSAPTKYVAMYIAKVIRDELEDFITDYFALTDEPRQMKEFNTIVRDAIYTALYAVEQYDHSDGAKAYADSEWNTIPAYWEEPKLTDDFVQVQKKYDRRTPKHRKNRTTLI